MGLEILFRPLLNYQLSYDKTAGGWKVSISTYVNTCIDSCTHHHNQDTQQFHHPQNFSHVIPSEDCFLICQGGERGVKI